MALFTALPFAMTQLGLEKIHHWQVYLPSTITGLIIMVPLIIVGETRNKLKQVFILGIICIAAAQIGLLFGMHSVWLITAYLIVYFIGFNVLEASLPSMVSKIAPWRWACITPCSRSACLSAAQPVVYCSKNMVLQAYLPFVAY